MKPPHLPTPENLFRLALNVDRKTLSLVDLDYVESDGDGILLKIKVKEVKVNELIDSITDPIDGAGYGDTHPVILVFKDNTRIETTAWELGVLLLRLKGF